VWLRGDFSRPTEVLIDGTSAGEVAYESGNDGNYASPLDVTLEPGTHELTVRRGGGSLRPGERAPARLVAIVFEPEFAARPAISSADPRRWRSLCGLTVDWVAVVRR
jgi:hypothetical protein